MSVPDSWQSINDPRFPKAVRMDLTGERHAVRGFNTEDYRLCLTRCNLIIAWMHGYGTGKEKVNCKKCYG